MEKRIPQLTLEGTMSEAELNLRTARLRDSVLNKARRGELETRLPLGAGRVVALLAQSQ